MISPLGKDSAELGFCAHASYCYPYRCLIGFLNYILQFRMNERTNKRTNERVHGLASGELAKPAEKKILRQGFSREFHL